MLLADKNSDIESVPKDPFKTIHSRKVTHSNIAEKVNSITYIAPTENIY